MSLVTLHRRASNLRSPTFKITVPTVFFDIGRQAFPVADAKTSNALPDYVVLALSVDSFRHHLGTLLSVPVILLLLAL